MTEQANEADVAEQQQDVGSGSVTDPPAVSPDEANEADALEQGAVVVEDDEDYPPDG